MGPQSGVAKQFSNWMPSRGHALQIRRAVVAAAVAGEDLEACEPLQWLAAVDPHPQQFGVNVAWVRLIVILYNLLSALKRLGSVRK